MKKKTLVALLLVLALACVPLAGCSGGNGYPTTKKLNLNNYVQAYSDTYYGTTSATGKSKKAYSAFATVDGTLNRISGTNSYGYTVNSEGKKVVYDIVARTNVLESKAYQDVHTTGAFLVGYNYDSFYTYDVYDPATLNLLTTVTSYDSLQTGSTTKYINGKPTMVYTLSYLPDSSASERSFKYFVYSEGSRTEKMTLSEVNMTDLKDNDYTVGSVISHAGDKEPIYDIDGIKKYDAMKDYTFIDGTVNNGLGKGGKIEFFKANAKSGEIDLKDGMLIGFVDKYCYYVEVEAVPFDAVKGYNFVVQTDDDDFASTKKLNYTYYRYDIVKNKVSKYNPGYIVVGFESMYNYKDSKYDALGVYGFKMVDGVANSLSAPVVGIADKDLKMGIDFTGKPFQFEGKLKDNRFIDTENGKTYIYNEKLETLAVFKSSSFKVNYDLGIITFAETGKYMAVDFDGKVVLDSKYSNLDFYGDTALTAVYDENGDVKGNMLVSKANPNGTEIQLAGDETLTYSANGILIIKKNIEGVNNYTVKNYNGAVITTFKASSIGSMQWNMNASVQYAYLPYVDDAGMQKTVVFG